ncbi:MAG: 4-hydroxy-tetrahydrodipicolinate reductase [Saprospiraceae bacterium]|nr:4-hydroxy-tetrahydrodipicolinate reductase [Saprospiraceae bacterium]MCB0543334.1 4-hydroxy-tetrahydrodipicolinate reductase [Saprospiraceae bacterium]MCB0574667.1 4-hydroxy-tetrahydrodipicolinate reductase [Saprospiraceae bacterium]MCB9306199.1 4-hydroxy-tetrahydrodipicolinate reductase [Lewinellaceae bacterium]MCB9354867.1 4-hydroxy-tetrahydrodipicolinate reductase [Lewinellaceae bacterium]
MLKIGLLGYGKMGRAIESLAGEQSVEIAWRISGENQADATPEKLREADVVIEFTRPESAFKNVMNCLEAGVPVVSGTTGWADSLPTAEEYCRKNDGAMLWASNFSVGVNLFFALNRYLSKLMDKRPEYAPSVTEVHHVHKLDAPSGTALSLVQGVIDEVARRSGWTLQPALTAPEDIPVMAVREGEVPGTHIVRWNSPVDEISIEHRAHSREGFAGGALLAAKWIAGKTGVFNMSDVLGL